MRRKRSNKRERRASSWPRVNPSCFDQRQGDAAV
jgi:hypothetical protein